MPTKHSGVGAAAAVAEVSSNGGRGGTRVRVEREELLEDCLPTVNRSQPEHRAASGLGRLRLSVCAPT